jgi:hypothetical protein
MQDLFASLLLFVGIELLLRLGRFRFFGSVYSANYEGEEKWALPAVLSDSPT